MKRVPEESTAWLTITFKDKEGSKETPSSAEYRIDSIGGTELRDWTNISGLSAEHELQLVPSDNKIVDDQADMNSDSTGDYQTNVITIHAEFGANDERNEEYKYQVEALSKIPKST